MTPELPPRDIARALIMDAENRVLLIAYETARDIDPARPGMRQLWLLPGGGFEPGESAEDALRRELAEEVGLRDVEPGRVVAVREGPFTLFRNHYFGRERYFLVRANPADIDTSRLAETESNPVLDTRWFTLQALQMSDLAIEPRGLLEVMTLIIHRKLGPEPVDLSNPPQSMQGAV
ncbi:NUDIX hydrolase [Salinarimonas soli]|uniref:NUDIX domain-containing protein n=1 Tax=Salinarimonas soli TaxID=1638099 RepID=A0A5B2VCA8_9HYPH|nr:NUDIX domain-containing protein [Salinarimonas soli]KAA2237093.1 NUDIX domain-containing protein [Salinarimonas soli]